MRKATFFTGKYFLNNRQFDISPRTRDNCLYMFHALKAAFRENGIDLSTQDINAPSDAEFIIYNEMPQISNDLFSDKVNYLLMIESKIERADNWDLKKHVHFKKIFTCFDELVDNKKYIKINYGQKIPEKMEFELEGKKGFCTMIASHKRKRNPLELYSERIRAIRWFERYHPEDFDLYGIGWDRYYFQEPFRKLNSEKLNKLDFLRKWAAPRYKNYRKTESFYPDPNYPMPLYSYDCRDALAKSKMEVLKKYKFCICYENSRDVPGYITEKIFDCFFAGCIPIYWGAPNIAASIPENTFIDKRRFQTYEGLYRYLKAIDDTTYRAYVTAIEEFVRSNKIYPFSGECFAKTIVDAVLTAS